MPAQLYKKDKNQPNYSVFPHHDHFVDVEAGPWSVANQLDDNNCQEQAFHRLFPPGEVFTLHPQAALQSNKDS